MPLLKFDSRQEDRVAEAPRKLGSHAADVKSFGEERFPVALSAAACVLAAGGMLLLSGETAKAQDAYLVAAVATEGAGPLGLGAIVGAVVAGAFALIERFRRR